MTAFLRASSDKFSDVNGGSDCGATCEATCNTASYDAATVTYKCPPSGYGDPKPVGSDCDLKRDYKDFDSTGNSVNEVSDVAQSCRKDGDCVNSHPPWWGTCVNGSCRWWSSQLQHQELVHVDAEPANTAGNSVNQGSDVAGKICEKDEDCYAWWTRRKYVCFRGICVPGDGSSQLQRQELVHIDAKSAFEFEKPDALKVFKGISKRLFQGKKIEDLIQQACVQDDQKFGNTIEQFLVLIARQNKDDARVAMEKLSDMMQDVVYGAFDRCKVPEMDLNKLHQALTIMGEPNKFKYTSNGHIVINQYDITHDLGWATQDWWVYEDYEEFGIYLGRILDLIGGPKFKREAAVAVEEPALLIA